MKSSPGLGQMMAYTVIGVLLGAMAAYKANAENQKVQGAEAQDDDRTARRS